MPRDSIEKLYSGQFSVVCNSLSVMRCLVFPDTRYQITDNKPVFNNHLLIKLYYFSVLGKKIRDPVHLLTKNLLCYKQITQIEDEHKKSIE